MTIEDVIRKTRVNTDRLARDVEDVRRFARVGRSEESNSHFIKFGVVSCRQFYKLHARDQKIVQNLAWRDFSYQLFLGRDLQEDVMPCKYARKQLTGVFRKMLRSQVGVPIVDATMIQLRETGIINNKQRLMIGYFVVKELGLDWRVGAQMFAVYLKDYDPSVNNFNWQWIASDFKRQNVWRQSKLIDKDCEVIKRYLPALKDLAPIEIHNWNERCSQHKEIDYPHPEV